MLLSAIAAFATNRVIGANNRLPWHLPADLKHFKTITTGKTILMGRKTFLSIGKALPNRRNIILTRDVNFQAPDCEVIHSIDAALSLSEEEIIIIGGAEIYQQFLPYIQRLYLTIIQQEFSGDVFFPEIDLRHWRQIERVDNAPDEKNPYPYSFILLERMKH